MIGLIPAGAGSGSWRYGSPRTGVAHPRGCGERPHGTGDPRAAQGSSPRVRGAAAGWGPPAAAEGLIPAGAGSGWREAVPATASQAHPRGCGERAGPDWGPVCSVGSSPRVRGAVGRPVPRRPRAGLIPAGAGSGHRPPTASGWRRAHPRGCGERWSNSLFMRALTGSSPRVRGAGGVGGWLPVDPGLIPAGAGSGPPSVPWPTCGRAHPRGCGERDSTEYCIGLNLGSSPRVRGAGTEGGRGGLRGGLIPAGAGSGPEWWSPAVGRRAHPRGCGERMVMDVSREEPTGSSPRVRGAEFIGGAHRPHLRLIPAGAGSGLGRDGVAHTHGAHPRGCGERSTGSKKGRPRRGSSPRVRGADLWPGLSEVLIGLIPAGAGSGSSLSRARPAPRAHPRGCGERAEGRPLLTWREGSSPRVRGAVSQGGYPVNADGLIPAGAGSGPRAPSAACRSGAHPRGCGERLRRDRAPAP